MDGFFEFRDERNSRAVRVSYFAVLMSFHINEIRGFCEQAVVDCAEFHQDLPITDDVKKYVSERFFLGKLVAGKEVVCGVFFFGNRLENHRFGKSLIFHINPAGGGN